MTSEAMTPSEAIDADYIVIGAGSAGSVVASRLSEDGARVLLLEAGGPDTNPIIHVPGLVIKAMQHRAINWNYMSEPEEGSGGRALFWPRGKVIGGSGSINGMNFVRGNPADFDGWAQRGARGWSYADVLPHFRAVETYQNGASSHRGGEGPLPVQHYRTILPLTHQFVKAAVESGHPLTNDINGEVQEGVGYSQMNRTRIRRSTARTFLARARTRANLRVETHAMAQRLTMEGRRCTGVVYRQGDRLIHARAARSVVLSGGAINSPHLLQLSGIGPAAHLQSLGIDVAMDAPGVGRDLSDHYMSKVVQRTTGMLTSNHLARFPRVLWQALRYLVAGDGLFTFGGTQVSVFCKSRPELASPDLQLMFMPVNMDPTRPGALDPLPGMSISVCVGRPDSRGTILACTPDPSAAPAIRPNYFSAATDRESHVAGMRIARKIFSAPALAPYADGETVPGTAVQSDDDLMDYTRKTGGSVYHPAGTCRMGEDAAAVVDSRLRLKGIDGLRVVDASVMPTLTTGNIQAPVIMIGEKGAAMIREDYRG